MPTTTPRERPRYNWNDSYRPGHAARDDAFAVALAAAPRLPAPAACRRRRRPYEAAAEGCRCRRRYLIATADPELEPQVTIIRKEDRDAVEEVRVNGELRYVKVTPHYGRPYYLVPDERRPDVIRATTRLDPGCERRCGCCFRGDLSLILLFRERRFARAPRRRVPRMSVYTPVTPDDLDAWLTALCGRRRSRSSPPIASGIENTNYFVTTERGPLRADALRAAAGRRAAVLSQPDGASRASGRRSPRADARPHRRTVLAPQRQAGEPRRRASTARRSTAPMPRRIARKWAPRSRGFTSRRRPIARG